MYICLFRLECQLYIVEWVIINKILDSYSKREILFPGFDQSCTDSQNEQNNDCY